MRSGRFGLIWIAVIALAIPTHAAQEAAAQELAAQEAGAQEPGTEKPAAQEAAPDPTVQLFVKKCASCHTIGEGMRVGPDLKDAHTRRTRDWMERLIREPSKMLDTDQYARQLLKEYKNVRMPDLGLKDEQVTALVDLIERCSAEPCDLSGAFVPVAEATPENMALGRRLFLGHEALSAGGPSCLSCHTVRGVGGFVGGGTLSKDLTHVFARLGDEGLDAALNNTPFPVMNKVYVESPLSIEEAFAIRSFLYDVNRAEPPEETQWSMAVLGVLGAALVLMVLNAIWRRRLMGVRSVLTHKAEGMTP